MKHFFSYVEAAADIPAPQAVTIGNFDGVHLGHRALLRAARRAADERKLPLAVLTFDPHPSAVLSPETARPSLTTPERKRALLAEAGVDVAVFQRFDESFAALSAEEFASEVLAKALHARRVIVGENFRFSRDREAGINRLSTLGAANGFEVQAESLASAEGTPVSSSQIRTLLAEGNVRDAALLLSRFHEVEGRVVGDRKLGRTFGFPTINLSEVRVQVPMNGIYAARVEIGGARHQAAVYIGDRPTQGAGFAVEAHLLDFEGDLYDRTARLLFIERIRGDMKFDSNEHLIEQIGADIASVRRILAQEQNP